jgi:F-type H+-transporting ATPase subunit delta
MNTGVVSMRYAKALFAYAKEQGVEDAIYRNMLQLMATLQQVKELAAMLAAPTLSKDERVRLLCSAVDSSAVYEDFMRLVVDEERESLLIFIAHCYVSLYRKAKNIVAVCITTAEPLGEEFCDRVGAAFAPEGATVELQNVVDGDIVGGFIYETETHRLDASIRRQLRDIETEFIKQNRKLV